MHDDRLAACCLLPLAPTNFYLPSSSKIRAIRFEVCVPLARHQGIKASWGRCSIGRASKWTVYVKFPLFQITTISYK